MFLDRYGMWPDEVPAGWVPPDGQPDARPRAHDSSSGAGAARSRPDPGPRPDRRRQRRVPRAGGAAAARARPSGGRRGGDDGRGALRLAEALAPDGVLLDVHLGADDGWAVRRALAALARRRAWSWSPATRRGRRLRQGGPGRPAARGARSSNVRARGAAAGGHRRGPGRCCATGWRGCSTDAGMEVVGRGRRRARTCCARSRAHRPDVAIVDVQMPPDRTDDGLRAAIAIRREHPGRRRARAVAVLRGALRAGPHRRRRRGRRLPAQGPRRRRRRVRRRRPPRRRRRLGARPRDRRAHGRPPAQGRSARRADAARARGARADGRGQVQPGIAEALDVTPAAVEKHVTRIFGKLELGHEPGEHRRVLAVLTLLRAS